MAPSVTSVNLPCQTTSMGSHREKPVQRPWIETPLVESKPLSKAAGCRIFLKLENLQPSTSFKSRGLGNLVLTQIAHHRSIGSARPLHFYSSSGGNAGLAAVTAAISLGYKCSVIVPTSTEASTIAKLKATGATEVISHGDSWFYADEYLRTVVIPIAEQRGEEGVYLPPFDHPDVWTGASSMIDEISTQMPNNEQPDAIICSVGGGGLFCGIMQGVDRHDWKDVQVLALETKGAESLHASVQQGELVTLPGITSIAKSLGAVTVARKAFENGQRKNVHSIVLEDAEAAMGCWRFADDERFLVEPACGVSVAMCYDGRLAKYLPGLTPESKIVVIVCGGSRISLDMLMDYRNTFEVRAEELRGQYRSTPATTEAVLDINGESVPSAHTS